MSLINVDRIKDFEKISAFRDEWNRLLFRSSQNCVFLTFEWFYSWWKNFAGSNTSEILLFRDGRGRLIGIAPLMSNQAELTFMASREVSDYCDFIVQRGKEEKFYRNFFDYTRENYSDIGRLHLMNVREDSPTLSFLKRSASAYRLTAEVPECEVSPRLELPQSYEQYMAALSRKNRHELRRKVKKIESSSGFLTKRIVDPEEVRSHIAEFIALHRGRSAAKDEFWQKKGIEDFFYDLLHVLSLKGWMELRLLYYEKSLAAVLIGFIYEGELSFYNIAFDSRFAAYSPGIYLFDVSIRWAIEQGFRRVDWLRGREKYKYYFGTKECKIKDFILSFRESKK